MKRRPDPFPEGHMLAVFNFNVLEGALPNEFSEDDQRRIRSLFDDLEEWLEGEDWERKPTIKEITVSPDIVMLNISVAPGDRELLSEYLQGFYDDDSENDVRFENGGETKLMYHGWGPARKNEVSR